MTAEHLGPFPTVDEVLNKFKSNGTFDEFRKTCLSFVEAEPSFRAYGEHIEVVSRRYLQNYKWRDSTTKNQVRSRLKEHALSVIASPDIQVGVPFSSLVEKAMESKGRELLPKIQDVVDTLRRSRPHKATPTTAKTADSGIIIETQAGEDNVQQPGVKFDLSLPIDLPGLAPSGSTKREGVSSSSSGNKGGKAKAKLVESGLREPKSGGGTKVKNLASEGNRAKSKEKEGETERCLVQEEGTENEEAETSVMADDRVKEKPKLTKTPKLKRTKEKVVHEKSNDEHEVKVELKSKIVSGTGATVGTVVGTGVPIDAGAPIGTTSASVGTTATSAPIGTSAPVSTSPKETETHVDNNTNRKTEMERKGIMPARRRSARLASLTEKNVDSELDSDRSRKDQVSSDDNGATSQQTIPRKKKMSSSKTRSPCRKRAKMIVNSSSDESEGEIEDCRATRRTRRTSPNRRRETENQSNRKRLRDNKEVIKDSTIGPGKIPRRDVSRRTGSSPNSSLGTTASSGPLDKMQNKTHDQDRPKPSRRKSLNPQRFRGSRTSKSPMKSPPPVTTRFNRHVKPNRRYYDSEEEEEEEKAVSSMEGSEPEEEEELVNISTSD